MSIYFLTSLPNRVKVGIKATGKSSDTLHLAHVLYTRVTEWLEVSRASRMAATSSGFAVGLATNASCGERPVMVSTRAALR